MTAPRIPRASRACSGPCDQGRRACPTPDARQAPDDSGLPGPAMALVIAIGLIAILAAVSLAIGACLG